MKTENFTQLIAAVTGRSFSISERTDWRNTQAAGEVLGHEKVYFVGMVLPLTGRTVGFDWKTPKSDEKMLRSFITAFTSKYREPDPATYGCYEGGNRWEAMSEEKREGAYGHHSTHMLSKEKLMKQVEARFECREMESALNQWGFYETEYGIGIFCFWETQYVRNAIAKMRAYLSGLNVSAREEYSDARWVYRFRIEASRELHVSLLNRFCQS
jgi:hypothetical protein